MVVEDLKVMSVRKKCSRGDKFYLLAVKLEWKLLKEATRRRQRGRTKMKNIYIYIYTCERLRVRHCVCTHQFQCNRHTTWNVVCHRNRCSATTISATQSTSIWGPHLTSYIDIHGFNSNGCGPHLTSYINIQAFNSYVCGPHLTSYMNIQGFTSNGWSHWRWKTLRGAHFTCSSQNPNSDTSHKWRGIGT